jgi:hypothetical protein
MNRRHNRLRKNRIGLIWNRGGHDMRIMIRMIMCIAIVSIIVVTAMIPIAATMRIRVISI